MHKATGGGSKGNDEQDEAARSRRREARQSRSESLVRVVVKTLDETDTGLRKLPPSSFVESGPKQVELLYVTGTEVRFIC
ncbi:MAG: hypothetical protein ABI988_12305 [Nitrospirota bacterium]